MTFPVFPGSNPSGYNLTRSLRFRSSASAYLNRTPASAGNRQTWTWSGWVKRGKLGSQQMILTVNYAGTTDSTRLLFYFDSTDILRVDSYTASFRQTNAVYRDPSAWYHVVLSVDTTQATAANRMLMYVNGVSQSFSSSSTITQNSDLAVNSTLTHYVGYYNGSTLFYDGYLTEVNFIDGQQLTPSSFGSTNTLTGVWQPAPYTGSYGTNGFYLPFTDNSVPTTTSNVGIGKDFSGNGNYWTSNNISVYGGTVQSFTSSTTWTAPAGVTSVNYLVVAGGGGGGSAATGVSMGGGGGAGGLLQGKLTVVPGTTYTVTVGAGGASTTNGGDSTFGSITATGGGAGAGGISSPVLAQNGGSGGGGFGYSGNQKGSGIAGQGFDGGSAGNVDVAGGGGGSSGVGGSAPTGTVAGSGGPGTVVSITGSAVTYAGGGGGGAYLGQTAGAGGSGGGGAGGSNADGSNATGYGSGGGGAGQYGNTHVGGAGSAGIVIIAYGSSATYDSMTDVPTLTSATAANFAVVNPLQSYYTPTNGNLTFSTGANSTGLGFSSIGLGTGVKFYFEATATGSAQQIGIFSSSQALTPTGSKRYWYLESGGLYNDGTLLQSVATFTSGDTIAVAWDGTAQTVTFYKNNTQQGTAISVDTSYSYFFGVGAYNGGWNVNFGQRPFTYTPPTGYVALNTYNLPTSTIVKGNTVMDATLYTGDNTSPRSITNAAGFKPDLVWIKDRSYAWQHNLFDSVRGAGSSKNLSSNNTNAEGVDASLYGYLSAFNANGFSTTNGTDPTYPSIWVNSTTQNYVAWQWQAGQGTTSTNTSGTISATVSVNASAGFSVVTYTGNGSAGATLGHGLGVAPSLIFIKSLSATGYWIVYSSVNGATKYLTLNTTDAVLTNAGPFNNTAPTSSVFSVGNSADVNSNGTTYVAYCWTPIAGYSAFGSYTGNGSSDGPFSYTGFRPKYVMTKKNNAAESWAITDSSRSPYNVTAAALYANATGGDDTTPQLDFLSNGFKIRDSHTINNANGDTYIYIAFAENPFKNALAR